MKEVLLNIRDKTILVQVNNGQGTVSSTLKDMVLPEGSKAKYDNAIDGLEAVILAHACLGLDIESEKYHDGIRRAVSDILGDYRESSGEDGEVEPREIHLDVGSEDRIEVVIYPDNSATVESSFGLSELDDEQEVSKDFLEMIAGLESLVLGHAIEGFDIEDAKYLEGLSIAVEAMSNQV